MKTRCVECNTYHEPKEQVFSYRAPANAKFPDCDGVYFYGYGFVCNECLKKPKKP